MAKGMYALIEIDDVIANSHHRSKVEIEHDRVRMMSGDKLNYPVSRMLRGFARSGIEIVLVSTKRLLNEEMKATKDWLSKHGIQYDHLVISKDISHLHRWLKNNQQTNIMVMVIAASNPLISMAQEHPHKPNIYRVLR